MGEKNNGKNCNGASVSWPRFFLEFILKKLAVLALKGGVGKSTVVARLSLALVGKGFNVGCVDLDVTGSNLYSALGLEHSPRWGLDSVNEKIIVPEVNGYWLLSIASFAGEAKSRINKIIADIRVYGGFAGFFLIIIKRHMISE